MTSSRRIAAFAVALLLLVTSSIAFGQTATDLETARSEYLKGRELRDTKNDFAGSLEHFKLAHTLGHTPITGLELGRTHMLLGHLIEARELFLAVARMPKAADESEHALAARAEAEKLAEEIRPRIGALHIVVNGVPPGTNPLVTIDGVAVGFETLGAVRKVDPGVHDVAVQLGTRPAELVHVTVAPGETKEVAVTLPPLAAPAPDEPKKAAVVSAPPAVALASGKGHLLLYVGASVAIAGATVGAVTGIVAFSSASSAKSGCIDSRCPPATFDDIDRSKLLGNVSTVSFIVAGAGAGLVVYELLTRNETPAVAKRVVTPWISANGAGLRGTF